MFCSLANQKASAGFTKQEEQNGTSYNEPESLEAPCQDSGDLGPIPNFVSGLRDNFPVPQLLHL